MAKLRAMSAWEPETWGRTVGFSRTFNRSVLRGWPANTNPQHLIRSRQEYVVDELPVDGNDHLID
jgi:hypothetical protein